MSEKLYALSLWQPWASLWLTDAKVHETRGWHTSFRGLLYVHAAKRPVRAAELSTELQRICIAELGCDYETALPLGAIIGVVSITRCQLTDVVLAYEKPDERDLACGNWKRGRYAWRRAPNPTHVGPWHYKGKQGLFRCDDLDAVATRQIHSGEGERLAPGETVCPDCGAEAVVRCGATRRAD